MLGVEKSSLNSPFAPAERCTDRADLLSSFASSHVRIALGGSHYNCVGSGGRQPRLRCRLMLVLVRAVVRVCPISPPHFRGHCWPWWVCLGLKSCTFLFTPVLLCTCLSLNVSFVWGQPFC